MQWTSLNDLREKYLSFFDGSQRLLLEFMPDGKIESLEREVTALYKICKGE